jgi:hypothetical protein
VLIALLVALIAAGCGRNPKNVRITEDNKDTFLEDIKDMKGLTVEEGRLLYAYMMRAGMAAAFGGDAPPIVGKTVGDLIESQRKIETNEQAAAEEQDRLAAEARAEEEARAAELRKAVSLTVYEKSFLASNPMGGRYSDYLVIKCAYENRSGKDIRAFNGSVRFTDLFDKTILESGLTISDPLKAGAKGTWTGQIEYNQFLDEHVALRNASLDNMKVVWLPSEVLYSDGTRVGAQQ